MIVYYSHCSALFIQGHCSQGHPKFEGARAYNCIKAGSGGPPPKKIVKNNMLSGVLNIDFLT